MELIATGAGKIISSASKSWSVTINGKSYSGTNSIAISNNTTKTLASGSTTISHNNDGTKSFDYSFSQQFSITFGGVSIGTKSGSGSGTLNTIPRASQPSLSATSVALGSAVTIYTNRASTSFTHTLSYKFGNSTGTISTGVGDNYAWTPVLSLANQIPSATSGSCTITCQTYNGSTLIGTKTINLTLTVPSSVVPSISSIALSAGNSVVPSSWGVYVQGKSTLKVVTTASGSYSSTIKSYKITGIDNNTYYSSNFTSSILQSSGTKTITVTVTDSRGRTATKTTTYNCVAYSNPSISTATVTRCNSDGTANEEGEYVKYTFKASVASVSNKNTYSYKLGYKLSGNSSYTYITISNSAYSLDKSNVVISGVTFSIDNSYEFQFLVTDYFTSTPIVKSIGTGFTLMDFNASGKGIAFGKVSELNGLEIGMNAVVRNKNLTLSNNVANTNTQVVCERTDKNNIIWFGIGSGGVNRGIYDSTLQKWLVYTNGSNVYLNGHASHISHGERNTTDTWIPVFNGGKLDYTVRKIVNAKTHTDYPSNQDYLPTMSFLSYWDGAYSSKNASNLTYCHQGTIQAKPTSLYDNSSGSSGTITLSQTSANFTYLEIYCKSNDGIYFSQKVYSPNGKQVNLSMVFTTESAAAYLKNRLITISGTSISNYGTRYSETKLSGSTTSTSASNNMYIVKVLGYK